MIIIKLQGGLGNQLFQYAAGRALSIKNNTALFFDLSLLQLDEPGITKRHFALSVFTIDVSLANKIDVTRISHPGIARKLLQKLKLIGKNIYTEPHFNYDPAFLNLKGDIIVNGYMQSEKYFKHVKPALQSDLVIKAPLSEKTNLHFEHIKKTNSVSIHIRRGDFVNDPNTKNVHGNCDIAYYQKAINLIASKVDDISLFVFSDDVAWTKEHLSTPYPIVFADHTNEVNAYEDLYLMSHCKHNIIANSSFSWWGAWLNLNPNKIVVAPRKWFNQSTANTNDLIPEEWIKI